MARRNGQLFEILTAQARQRPGQRPGQRSGSGRGAATPAGRGVGRALAAGRAALERLGLETRPGQAAPKSAARRAAAAGPGVPVGAGSGGLGSGATTLLIAALIGLLVGFGIGRWSGGDGSAQASGSREELRRDASGQEPGWVDSSRRGAARDPLQLDEEEQFEALSQFGFVLLGYPAFQSDRARQVMAWLHSQSFLSTRLRRSTLGSTGEPYVAVVVYTDEARDARLAEALRELNTPAFAPELREKLRKLPDEPLLLQ
jgi:hypothetical protein